MTISLVAHAAITSPDNSTPEPDIDPLNQTLEQIIKNESQGLDRAQFATLADSFQQTVWAIDRGSVTTPAGARETLRKTWLFNGMTVNPQTVDNLAPLIEAISGKIDNTSLTSVKRDYNAVIAALRAIK